jgi:hypothetical protein
MTLLKFYTIISTLKAIWEEIKEQVKEQKKDRTVAMKSHFNFFLYFILKNIL